MSLVLVVAGAEPARAAGIACPDIAKVGWAVIGATHGGSRWRGFVYSPQV